MENIYTAEEIVAEIFSRLDNADTRDEAVFYNWIYSAIRELGSSSLDIKSECVEPVGCCVTKPCDFGGLVELVLTDSHGSVPFVFSNTSAKTDRGDYYSNNNAVIYVSEEDTKFNLSSNATNVKNVEIRYYGLPIDSEGLPFVREILREAVIAFCEYQWMKRERNRRRKEIPMSEVDWYKGNWEVAKRTAKGRNKMISPVQAETILRKWVTMIPKYKTMDRHRRVIGIRRKI
jgi:hypothetical protein